jgi:hypothetical protein
MAASRDARVTDQQVSIYRAAQISKSFYRKQGNSRNRDKVREVAAAAAIQGGAGGDGLALSASYHCEASSSLIVGCTSRRRQNRVTEKAQCSLSRTNGPCLPRCMVQFAAGLSVTRAYIYT